MLCCAPTDPPRIRSEPGNRRFSLAPWVCLLALPGACGGDVTGSAAADGGWRVERSTDGAVTTVRNIAGSKWGADATLELQLEIGLEDGPEEYLLAQPAALWATDEEIFVLDFRLQKVRVYGRDGVHRRDIGREGQGPGEFEDPMSLVVTDDDEIVVGSFGGGGGRLSFFALDGTFLEAWRIQPTTATGRRIVRAVAGNLLATSAGIFTQVRRLPEDPTEGSWKAEVGLQKVGPDGLQGEPWLAPPLASEPPLWTITIDNNTLQIPAPLTASAPVVSLTPDGRRVWGHPDEYRFHIEGRNGTETIVERVTDPVRVDPEHARYERDTMITMEGGPFGVGFEVSGDLATERAFYDAIRVDDSGRIWVTRTGAAKRIAECTPVAKMSEVDEPVACWEPRPITDIFNLDGEYLGELAGTFALGFGGGFVAGSTMVTAHEDEMGTPVVRVYSLTTPQITGVAR